MIGKLLVATVSCQAMLLAHALAETNNVQLTLDKELTGLYAKSHVPGFCVAVFDADKVLYQKGFGFADIATTRPYTADTVQPIASISKTLIGIALMQGVEKGWFTLDTDVNDILPFRLRNPAFPDTPITIRQLATHTSSILDREGLYEASYFTGPHNDLIIGDFLKNYFVNGDAPREFHILDFLQDYFNQSEEVSASTIFAKTAPGTAYSYSNIGATVAAYIVELKSGERYADYTRHAILEPLGMTQSGWTYATSGANAATLYTEKGIRPYPPYQLTTYPDGGLRTSCTDLVKLVMEVMRTRKGNGRLLSATSVNAMLEPQFKPGHSPAGYDITQGANVAIFWKYRRDGTVGHFGDDPGTTTFMGFDAKTNLGRIIFSNVDAEEDVGAYSPELFAIWDLLARYDKLPTKD